MFTISDSMSDLVDQFMNSTGQTMNKLHNALVNTDKEAISSIISSIKNNAVLQHIATLVQSSEAKRTEFVALANETRDGGQVFLGVYLSAVGALAMSNAATIGELLTWALSATAATALVEAVAVILLVIAASLLLKAGIRWITGKWQEVQTMMNSITEE